jgi:cell filamentation protein
MRRFIKYTAVTAIPEKSAHFLAELNAIHAFREDKGRAQSTFFALLADCAGRSPDLQKLNPHAMLNAIISSFAGDEGELAKLIKELIS